MSERETKDLVKRLTIMSLVVQILGTAFIVAGGIAVFYFKTTYTLSDHEKRILKTEISVDNLTLKHDNDVRSINSQLLNISLNKK